MTGARDITWRKSSHSHQETDCVEVRLAPTVGVRDTKDRAGGQLDVAPAAWVAFTREAAR
ncbi:DUF397 domain-containing protein [Amycolatopsis sp. CA-230715]|uniref:DUF397 domain-containing protein n=1 Tax=Amycolatopsis sp. CA-230715 TaxID=2745196 RepID=UPI001C022FFF|nr:DUF397 domain-containing protein [Amycolatopsis sp. CA-230715]QWF83287.1 hypothetical protein HUW46_06727 [Amycolatopsis sp. CA-230715]